jgi:hypothetical protein
LLPFLFLFAEVFFTQLGKSHPLAMAGALPASRRAAAIDVEK